MVLRRSQRQTASKVSSTFQDLEVLGTLKGPQFSAMIAAIEKLTAQLKGLTAKQIKESAFLTLNYQNLVWYLSLDEPSGTVAADGSDSGVDATICGSCTHVAGPAGKQIDLPGGASDYIEAASVPALGSAWSISFLTKPGLVDSTHNIIISGTFPYVSISATNKWNLSWRDSGGTQRTLTATVGPTVSTQYHVVAKHDGTTASIWINGTMVAQTSSWNTESVASATWRIGNHATGGYPYQGTIDEVRLYSRALDEDEIMYLTLFPSGAQYYQVDTKRLQAGSVIAEKMAAKQVRAREMACADDIYETWDEIPAGAELFDLCAPDCRSSLGRRPKSWTTAFLAATVADEQDTEIADSDAKFAGVNAIGLFDATTNLVASAEDLTASSWTATALTPTLSAYTFGPHTWTKLECTGASTAYTQTPVTLGVATPVVHAKLRKGSPATSADDTWLVLYDTTAPATRLQIEVDWSTNTVTATTGTLQRSKWYGTDIVEVWGIATGAVTTNTNVAMIYPNINEAAGNYCYATAIMVTDSTYPVPYCPTSRAASDVRWAIAPDDVGTIDFLFFPMFTYDIGSNVYVLAVGAADAATANSVFLRYSYSNDRWEAYMQIDGSNYRMKRTVSNVVASNADLWKWWHFRITWDIPNSTITLRVDGANQSTSASAGAVSSLAFAESSVRLGIGPSATNRPRGWFNDLMYLPGTADNTSAHYDTGKPWYDPDEFTDKMRSVRIGLGGLRMNNGAGIAMYDQLGRYMGINPREGLLARDSAGTTIHDIPTAPILSDMIYGGHVLWREAPGYVSSILLTYTDTNTSRTATSSLTYLNLSSYLPVGLTNVRGGLVSTVIAAGMGATTKAAVSAESRGAANYYTNYAGTGGGANYLGEVHVPIQATGWTLGGNCYSFVRFPPSPVPIVWNAGTPYFIYSVTGVWTGMAAPSGTYYAQALIYLMGWLV